MRCDAPPCPVIVLAGDRPGRSGLLEATGADGKALISLLGIPLLARVLQTVSTWPACQRMILVAPKTKPYLELVAGSGLQNKALTWLEPQASLYESLAEVFNDRDLAIERAVIVTGDHALLRVEWLETIWSSLKDGVDLAVGLADGSKVMAAFPAHRRTRYRFSDQHICGGNIFAFKMPAIHTVLDHWRRLEQQRKRPWRMVSILGHGYVWRYLTGRLSLASAFECLSCVVDATVVPVIVDDPSIAVDIDSMEDLKLAESILCQRGESGSGMA